MRGYRVWAEIDLAALRHNVAVVRHALSPGARVLAVLKADAYGHGARAVAPAVLHAGADRLGVGDSTEALELRESGVAGPILILGAILEEEIPKVVQHDVGVSAHSADLLPLLDLEARRRDRLLRVHLKIDTGMARLGVSPGRARDVARAILERPNLRLEGLSTHFARAADPDAVREQLAVFRAVADELAADGIRPPVLHAANSAGLFTDPGSHFDLVRPGIALYGIDPGPFARLGVPLRPVLTLKTQIACLKGVPAGTPIGYEGRHVTARPTRIATCPAGYNDGLPYALSGRGEAVVRGRRAPFVGTVTMDYVMLDVGDVPGVAVGDDVTLIGEGMRAEDVARRAGTLPYELTCRLGRRVGRVVVGAEAVPVSRREVA